MRVLSQFAVLALMLGMTLRAATLERLSLDDMSLKSTAIVRARVLDSYAARSGRGIYTHYRVQVSESWKGTAGGTIDVAVPGGVYGGMRETVPGAPALIRGSEYVLFLWTGSSGITQVIGLSQGLFSLKAGTDGEFTANRAATTETMLDALTGKPVRDVAVSLKLSEMRQRVNTCLASRGQR